MLKCGYVKKKCEHGKQKSQCKACYGSGICEHGSQKSRCTKCHGSQICEHGRRKQYCKACNGSQICEHGRHKSYCKACHGSAICEHGIAKYTCKACHGSAICEHGIAKYTCKACIGSRICEHGIQKSQCKVCVDSRICEHGIHKAQCKICGGSAFCEHEIRRSHCKKCGGSELCKTPLCETKRSSKYNNYRFTCFFYLFPDEPNVRNYKTKEKDVVDRIIQFFPHFTWIADKKVQDGCSKRRPDLLLDMGSHILIVEIDEHKHTDYDCSCEHKRLMELSQDLHHRPIVFIRFNPDAYVNQEGMTVTSCWKLNKFGIMTVAKSKVNEWEERTQILQQQIQYWIENPSEKTIEIIELFY